MILRIRSNGLTITAAMVKELRERTGLGMMDCKKALVAAGGDMELAIEELRKKSVLKASVTTSTPRHAAAATGTGLA